ncbi:MAG: hypothetical protein NC118_15495 [Eubacterium sp.]|nr:hypothetical protein [Eubacterium sp.]
MAGKEDSFHKALAGKKIPILTLDNKWHKLFGPEEMTSQMKSLEKKLNDLIKRQGKLNTESKDIQKIKKKLMDEIIVIADDLQQTPDSKKLSKDREDHRRLVKECNDKMSEYEEELYLLPKEIDRANRELMMTSMDICYKKIQTNDREIHALDDWIKQTRRELKKKLIRKQEKEEENNRMYAYMHDIFGADVLELFDAKYRPEDTGGKGKKNKKDNAPKS